MKGKTILLVVVVALIVGAIYFLDSNTPDEAATIDSEIQIPTQQNQQQQTNTANTEQQKTETAQTNIRTDYPNEKDLKRIEEKAKKYERAKEIVDPEGYINTDKITVTEQIGKNVVLLDFWTYSCINCQRTLPYLNAWDKKYSDKGLVILGIHTPEFDFEKDYNNLQRAVEKYGVEYPVIQDNDKQTWRAYGNRYWPRKYLIDIDGFIVYDHIGEGGYEQTEKIIQDLLEERNHVLGLNKKISTDTVNPDAENPSAGAVITKEVYFGYKFQREQLGNEQGWQPDKIIDYTAPTELEQNMFYLNGNWLNNEDNMQLVGDEGAIKLRFLAKKVNIVAGAKEEQEIEVYVDGKLHKSVKVQAEDLYNIASFDKIERANLEIKAKKGLMAYTFTFG